MKQTQSFQAEIKQLLDSMWNGLLIGLTIGTAICILIGSIAFMIKFIMFVAKL